MAEKDNISSEIETAVDTVVKEELEKETPPENQEEHKEVQEKKTPEKEDIPTAFTPDDALTERAVRLGLSLKDVKGFSSAEMAESILTKLEEAAKSKSEKSVEKPNEDDDESPVAEFEKALKEMEDDKDEDGNSAYDPKILSVLKAASSIIGKQAKELSELKRVGVSTQEKNFFDEQVKGLGEEVVKHLDASSKSKLESKFKMLEAGYKASKAKISREDIFKEATTLAIGDILAKANAESKAAKVTERKNLTIARPGGEQGKKSGKAETLDDIVSQIAKELN